MSADAELAAEEERHDWLDGLNGFEQSLILGYLAAMPEIFDRARAYVERIRAAKSA